jgi:chemotaxis protein methyltransferase CheR
MFMQLLQYLTIPVSEMFRDPALPGAAQGSGAAAAHLPVDQDLDRRLQHGRGGVFDGHPAARRGLLERTIIYATDINPRSLDKAKQGIYSMQSMREYTENYRRPAATRLRRLLHRRLRQRDLRQSLRDNVTFADHSLATDSVFSETQLVSCRNVLIYFNKELQDRAFGCSMSRCATVASWCWAARSRWIFRPTATVRAAGQARTDLPQIMNGVRAVVIGASAAA